jgi:3-ketosteroid 9alpha-monooxygenase subunit B
VTWSVPVPERGEVVRRHGYHTLRVKGIVEESGDTRSFLLDVPSDLEEAFRYRAGQFCTFRVRVGGEDHARCYSMSSAPETDDDLVVTVKRVPGGLVSNWLNDHVAACDVLEVTGPMGTFCAAPAEQPIIAFCGGSGVTPVLSIAKSVLAVTGRSVRILYANRDPSSVIFGEGLGTLQARHPERFELRHHFDLDGGFVDAPAITAFVGGHLDAHFYICGPGPFMDLVEGTLLGMGVDPGAIFIERFETAGQPGPPDLSGGDGADVLEAEGPGAGAPDSGPPGSGPTEQVVLILRGKKSEITYHAGDTVLETARRASLPAPYSCEAGSCATCMALIREGTASMRVNNALTSEELAEGWVLTCQALPTSPTITIEYEPL